MVYWEALGPTCAQDPQFIKFTPHALKEARTHVDLEEVARIAEDEGVVLEVLARQIMDERRRGMRRHTVTGI